MKSREIILFLGTVFLMLPGVGCHNPPKDAISKALASTNVVFRPIVWREPDIPLTQAEGEKIKNIVAFFNQRSKVRIESDLGGTPEGHFILGDVQFGWAGASIDIHDPKTGRYYLVEDAALEHMWDAFTKAEGEPPLKSPTREKWQEILSVLGKTNQ